MEKTRIVQRKAYFDNLITKWSNQRDKEYGGKEYTAGYLISLVASLLAGQINEEKADEIAATHFSEEE